MKKIIFALFVFACNQSHAAKVDCTQDKNNLQLTCFNPKDVRSNGNVRSTPLYMGGPNQIDKTPYTLVTNCEAGYVELRDKKGVVFARDQPTKLHSVMLREKICEASSIPDKHLK